MGSPASRACQRVSPSQTIVVHRLSKGKAASGGFIAAGLDRKHWSTAGPIRRIFRQAFNRAGLPSFCPHSFRNTLAQLGEQICNSPEEFKAWSQNLGHENVLTTYTSYGAVAPRRQAILIRGLDGRSLTTEMSGTVEARLARLEALASGSTSTE
jgi:integrase